MFRCPTLRSRLLPLMVALVLAGCTDTGSGDPEGSGGPGDASSSGDSAGGDPAATVTRADGAADSEVCQVFQDADLEFLFARPVTVSGVASEGKVAFPLCVFRLTGHDDDDFYIEIDYFANRPARSASSVDTEETTVADHPAVADATSITVSTGMNLDQVGALTGIAHASGIDPDLPDTYECHSIMVNLLELAVDQFAR